MKGIRFITLLLAAIVASGAAYAQDTSKQQKKKEKLEKEIEFLNKQIKETNAKRIKVLYKKAVKCFKETKLGEARNYADMCYSLDPTDIKLKILVDQINMEII